MVILTAPKTQETVANIKTGKVVLVLPYNLNSFIFVIFYENNRGIGYLTFNAQSRIAREYS
jgi:hypothetical protein